jgi:tRNA A-37 threonylcarbamoyl transferase component Bud32
MQGEIIDSRWELLQSIGNGGMGEVFVARHTTLETIVALKLLKPELSQDATSRAKMVTEAKAAAKVRHPNVVLVSDVGQTKDGVVFIVMEHVDGHDLKTLLDREGPLAIDRARSLLGQIASGLAAAHANKVIHRDVKPANCVVAMATDGTEVVKILDFGIAKILEDTNDTAKESPTTNRWFTRHYVAPEVEKGHASDERSDVYSFGVLAYRMLTGHYPYEKTFKAITPPEHYRSEIPCDLCELIRDSLRTDPDDRPSSMSRVCQRLLARESVEHPSDSFDSSDSLGGRTSPIHTSLETAPDGRTAPRTSTTLVRWGRWALFLGAWSAAVSMAAYSSPGLLQPMVVAPAFRSPEALPPEPGLPTLAEPHEQPEQVERTSVDERIETAPLALPPKTVPPAPAEVTSPTEPTPRARPPRTDPNQQARTIVKKCLQQPSASRCFGEPRGRQTTSITISFSVRSGRILSPDPTTASPETRECINSILESCDAIKLADRDYIDLRVRF